MLIRKHVAIEGPDLEPSDLDPTGASGSFTYCLVYKMRRPEDTPFVISTAKLSAPEGGRMIGSVPLQSSSASSLSPALSSVVVESADKTRGSRSDSFVCCARSRDAYIPKLEPFSRSKIERGLKEPSLIQKTENDLSDYCTTLEGDKSYSCWKAYFELKELEKESPKDDVEHLIRQTDGVRSLIGLLHGVTAVREMAKKDKKKPSLSNEETGRPRPFPIPDGLPKTQEELEEEDRARMPDSPFTRVLRSMGTFPAWYSPAPDHETD